MDVRKYTDNVPFCSSWAFSRSNVGVMSWFLIQRCRTTLLVGLRLPLGGNALGVGTPLHTNCQCYNLNGNNSNTGRRSDPGDPFDWFVNLVMPGLNNWLLGSSPKLYKDHVPTSALQKSVLAVGSSVGAFLYPERDGKSVQSVRRTCWGVRGLPYYR